MTDNTKRYQVRAEKRPGAREDLAEVIHFIVRETQYKDAWSTARKLCAQGGNIEQVPNEGGDPYEAELVPGQYTCRAVHTIDKPQAAASGGAKKDVSLTDFKARLTKEGIDLDKNQTTRRIGHLMQVMWEEIGFDTGNEEAKAEAHGSHDQHDDSKQAADDAEQAVGF